MDIKDLTQEELDKLIEERDHFKKMYENFAKRISNLKKFSGAIAPSDHMIWGDDKIDRTWVWKKLKAIGFGQEVPLTYQETMDTLMEK
jgi:hypothetical protein